MNLFALFPNCAAFSGICLCILWKTADVYGNICGIYDTIIGGVNGVGKSSFTGVLRGSRTDLGMIIDEITAELGAGTLAGGKAALKKISDCIAKGVSFSQETTLSGYKAEATAKQVKELGYHVRLFYIGLDTVTGGSYTLQIRNNSDGEVKVSGFVNY